MATQAVLCTLLPYCAIVDKKSHSRHTARVEVGYFRLGRRRNSGSLKRTYLWLYVPSRRRHAPVRSLIGPALRHRLPRPILIPITNDELLTAQD